MGSKGWPVLILAAMTMMMLPSTTWSLEAPPDCSSQIVEMQSCLSFVEGSAEKPGDACCSGLSSVYTKSPACLCDLMSSQNGGLSSGIDMNNALRLPSICKVPADPSRCTALLSPGAHSTATPPLKAPSADSGRPSAASSAAVHTSQLAFKGAVFFVSLLASELLVLMLILPDQA